MQRNRSAHTAWPAPVRYDTRPRNRRSTLVDKLINKSDRAIMWLHMLCKPHKNERDNLS